MKKFKVGDKVVICRKVESYSNGCLILETDYHKPSVSRNKREGRYAGKFKGVHFRSYGRTYRLIPCRNTVSWLGCPVKQSRVYRSKKWTR